jgi:hypothetical protein
MFRILVMSLAAGYVWYLLDHNSGSGLRQLSTAETLGVITAALSFAIAAVVRLPGRHPKGPGGSGFFVE